MMKLGKYMTAHGVGMVPREVYTIHDSHGGILGTVEWYKQWKQYVIQPESSAAFSAGCLRDLETFLDNCNRAQKVVEHARGR